MEKLEILQEDGAKTGVVMERYEAHMAGALHGVMSLCDTYQRGASGISDSEEKQVKSVLPGILRYCLCRAY